MKIIGRVTRSKMIAEVSENELEMIVGSRWREDKPSLDIGSTIDVHAVYTRIAAMKRMEDTLNTMIGKYEDMIETLKMDIPVIRALDI